MTKPIAVNYLFFHGFRQPYVNVGLDCLSRIGDEAKAKIHVNLFVTRDFKELAKNQADILDKAGIEASIDYGRPSYMLRAQRMAEGSSEFMVKLDNDIFLNEHAWDFWINNIEQELSQEDALLATPVLSSGIPTCDRFMDTFMQDRSEKLEEILQRTKFPSSIWGHNCYGGLSAFVKRPWDPKPFFEAVSKLPAPQKGVHPIRFNFDLINYINDFCADNVEAFLEKRGYSFSDMPEPYLCNSCIAIKTATYKKIIEDRSLKVDAFDEIPINKYRHREGKKIRILDNCFGIHPMYAIYSMSLRHACNIEAEKRFFKKFYERYKALR